MRKKYEQVTSALSYLTKHLYLEYKEFSKLNSKKKKKIQFGKQVEQTLHQRGYTDGKCKHEKIFNTISHSVQFSRSVVSDSVTPLTTAHQASLSITSSWSLLKLMSIESVMPSNHLILCRPLLLPPSIFPSIRVFSKN